jgi:hypothetical protein
MRWSNSVAAAATPKERDASERPMPAATVVATMPIVITISIRVKPRSHIAPV